MSYGSMNNPYTQPPRSQSRLSLEDSFNRLIRLKNPPNIGVVLPIIDQYSSLSEETDGISWNTTLVERLTQLSLRCLDDLFESVPVEETYRSTNSEGSLAIFYLLTLVMEEWSDELMYHALTQHIHDLRSGIESLLGFFTRFVTTRNDVVHRLAYVGLSTSYRSMDRLDRYLTLDVSRPDLAWWFNHVTEPMIATFSSVAVDILLSPPKVHPNNNQSQSTSCEPCSEQLQLAASSFLCTLLKRDVICGSTFRNEVEVDAIYRLSLQHVQILIGPQHPTHYSTRALHLTFMHVSLINLIQWRQHLNMNEYEAMVESTLFIDNLVNFLLSYHGMDETTQSVRSKSTQEQEYAPKVAGYALDVIHCWALSRGDAWKEFLKHEKRWRSSIAEFWNHTIAGQINQLIPLLPTMVLLHSHCRLTSRAALSSLIETTCNADHSLTSIRETMQAIVSTLVRILHSVTRETMLYAVLLFRVLLSDRCSQRTHDALSRALWESLDTQCLEQIVGGVLKVVDTNQGVVRPLTLALLDLLNELFQDPVNCDLLLKSLPVERFEGLVTILESKKVKFDFKDTTAWNDLSLDLDSDTPPANNLSRIDESSICVEQEHDAIAVGLDETIQLSCATLLATLGYKSPSAVDEGINLLKARACSIVIDFAARYHEKAYLSDGLLSFDTAKRTLRLQLAVCNSENEGIIAATLFSGQLLQQRLHLEMQHNSQTVQARLRAAEDRAGELERQVRALKAKNVSQSIILQRELSRLKESTSQDAKQLVAIHVAERSVAESRVVDYRVQLERAENKAQDTLVRVVEAERVTVKTKEELQQALEKIDEFEKENRKLSRRIDEDEAKSKELKEIIHSQNEKCDSLVVSRKRLEADLCERDHTIQSLEGTKENLKDNLEELFADMFNLATVYEFKESELTALRQNHYDEMAEARQDLLKEKERSKVLQKSNDELRESNERLQRKLERYKQRLEDERSAREEENSRRKRNGPVSYFNQLHQPTSMDRSRDRSAAGDSGSGYLDSRSRLEKENSSTHFSMSTHRKKY